MSATAFVGSAASPVTAEGSRAAGGGGDTVVLAAMQRDLSLTADEAGARLKKEAWAGGAERMLRETLGSDFGGAWMSKDGRELMIGVTSDEAADAVREAGAKPKRVARGESELLALKKRLDGTRAADGSVTGWYVDPATNNLVLVARPEGTSAARRLAARGGVPSDAVRVVTTQESPKLLFDVRGADPYFIDNQSRCSIGFAVEGGFVTAGHCGAVGSTTTGFNEAPQGTVRASVFPGDGDFGFVEVNEDWTPQPVVATSNGVVEVAGAEEAPVGASICRSGSTTGTRCGVIEAKNATVNYPEGAVTGLTQTDVCAEGGDSGGPWLSGNQAQGVTSGGSGDCTVGGTTFFQPLTEILTVNNLRLITTGDAGGDAGDAGGDAGAEEPPADEQEEAPAAVDCEAAEATVEGALRGSGARAVQPSAGFFRAGSGTHEACLNAPSDADFDLALQQWTGERWRTAASADDGQEALTFSGSAGFYRYVVSSDEGSGEYVVSVNVP